MASKAVLILAVLAVTINSLEMLVNSLNYRCMVVYSTNEEHHLKIDMKFPSFSSQAKDQYYQILLENTELETSEVYTIEQGTFRKEIQLSENIVYKLCMRIVLDRSGVHEIQQYVEYKTSVKHSDNVYQSKIEIPESLLKIKDLSRTYSELRHAQYLLITKKAASEVNIKEEEAIFEEQNRKIQNIQLISFIELGAICVIGIFQYWRLKSIIQTRQS